MSDNELLLAISNIVAAQVEPLKKQLTRIEVDLLENNVIPRISEIERCYTSTFERYRVNNESFEMLQNDVELLKKVVEEHSEKLQKIS